MRSVATTESSGSAHKGVARFSILAREERAWTLLLALIAAEASDP